mgnify:CR=1 FL=1
MDYKAIIDFLVISVPEQFLMAMFVWVLLGRDVRENLKKISTVGISAAIICRVIYEVFIGEVFLASILQVVVFGLLIYFVYKLDVFESLVCCLITFVVFITIQSTCVILFRNISGFSEENFYNNTIVRIALIVPELLIVSVIMFVLHKRDINFNYLKIKKLDKSQVGKIRFLILQLVFAFFILVVIYIMFFKKIEYFSSSSDKALLLMSFFITIVFTVVVVKSAFIMNDSIQKEEELKRKRDGREFIQNIDYLCTLIDTKEYGELKKILQSIRRDIDSGMININEGTDKADLHDV